VLRWQEFATRSGICNSVGGSVFLTCHHVAGGVANMVGVKARVVNRKQVDVTLFGLSWNALIAHCMRRQAVH